MSRRIYLIMYICCCVLTTFAQSTEEQYRRIYDAAELDYQVGRLEQAEQQLKTNLKNFPINLRQSAYRVLSLCYIAMDRTRDAEDCVKMLLDENPYYSTTLSDPQRFIDMVDDIKSGMMPTITTASSQAENLSEVPVPITLITEEMIHSSGARNLQEVLAAYVPGMNIIDCNDDINIAMRGIYSNGQEKILIMLNGHRLNSYCTNTAAPDFSIGLDKLKQIEVLRGPASSLYGGVALTAVVNLITKQGADVDGIKLRAGIGNYGQYRGDLIFGKRYFDLDLLIWGSFHLVKGQKRYLSKEETGLNVMGGDVNVGGVGPKPSYDFGTSIKYKNLQFLYNTQYSQVEAPLTMTHLASTYNVEKYKTFYGIRPSHTTISHHADLKYGQQLGDFCLMGQVAYDNSDLTHYQVISDHALPGFKSLLPLPESSLALLSDSTQGLARYISGQEHTFGIKAQTDWNYISNEKHQGLLTVGAEFNYFKLDDARYVFVYDYMKTLPETINVSELGKGHENNANVSVQLKHQWGPIILNAGLRYDYKNRYDETHISEFSPRVALIYLQPKWNVKLSYAKSFIDAPYLYRKTNQFLMAFLGAKGSDQLSIPLTPESLHSYQLTFGATQWLKGLDFEVNAFYNHAKDLITMDLIAHYNMENSDIYGIEVSSKYDYRRFSAYLTASWQKTKSFSMNKQNSYVYPNALNMPEFSSNLTFLWRITDKLKLHTHLAFSSKQISEHMDVIKYVKYSSALMKLSELYELINHFEEPPMELLEQLNAVRSYINGEASSDRYMYKDIEVDPYFVADIGASYKIGNLEMNLNVNNVLNNKYSLSGACTGNVPQNGRWYMFDFAYKF